MSNMQGMQLNTDFTNIKPNLPGGASIPVTTDKLGHLVHIVESGPRETKSKNGMMVVLKLEIIDGPHKGTIGEHNINVANPNQQAVEIGYAELSAIAHVTGVLRVGNTVELHRKPFRILVRQQKENPQYTEVYGILDANGNEPGRAGQGALTVGGFGQQQQQPPQGGFGGQQPQGGFQPQGNGFQPQTQAAQPPQGNNGGFQPQGGGDQPGWAGSAAGQPQAVWQGGGQQQQNNGQPGWAGNGS